MPDLPPLYKYLDVQGARLTLGNRTFKHSKPSDFNDTEELTIRSIFPESTETALVEIKNGLPDILLKHLDEAPTGGSVQMRHKIGLIQGIYRNNPGAAKIIGEGMRRTPISDIYDLDRMRETFREFVTEINDLRQRYRILCVSEIRDSDKMWVRYAQCHEGIVVRIVPNAQKDSKFQKFRKVEYREARPPLYESALSFYEDSQFGDQEKIKKALLDKIIYTKTREWEEEKEYRLAIWLGEGEEWSTLSYHSEEISELYLGQKMADEVKREIVGLARAVNPEMHIFFPMGV
jgi:hypothetical protein